MDQPANTPNEGTSNSEGSENQPEWFSRVNNESTQDPAVENSIARPKQNRIIPIVAALAIVGAAAAYGVNRNASTAHGINDSLVSRTSPSMGNSQGNNNLPAPTITNGPQGGPGFGHPEGVDPDGDDWAGTNRHREPFDPNHPHPPHGDGDGEIFHR